MQGDRRTKSRKTYTNRHEPARAGGICAFGHEEGVALVSSSRYRLS